MREIPLLDLAGMPAAERDALGKELAPLRTLADVLAWGRSRVPPLAVSGIVTQDEYTHDVIVALGPERYLGFDTT